MPSPIVVFDLDGTLIDTAPDLVGTLNLILAQEGVPPVPYAEARKMIGGGAKLLIERGLVRNKRTAERTEIERLFTAYLDHYAAHIADASRPFEGLVEALDRLEADGFRFAVCTNKLEWLATKLLDELALTRRFAAICGQDTFSVMKPHPDALMNTIARAQGDPSRAIMVGDSGTDIAVAGAAGIPVVAVDFGYTETPIEQLGPDRVISHFDQLPAAVTALLADRKRAELRK